MSYADQDADDLIMSSVRKGHPAAKWPRVGHIVSGYVTKRPTKTEQRDEDNKPKTFDDGTVRMQVLIDIQTQERDPDIPDDDGQRTIWGKWEIQKAVGQALINAGVRRLEVGGFLEIGRSDDIPPVKKIHKPTQTFVAQYTPPAVRAADDAFTGAVEHSAQAPAPVQFSGPPKATGGVVFENQHQDVTAPAKPAGGTTLDQLRNTSFNAQGAVQNQEPPF